MKTKLYKVSFADRRRKDIEIVGTSLYEVIGRCTLIYKAGFAVKEIK